MGKAKKGRSGLVDFPEDSKHLDVAQIENCLRDAGFSSDDQAWLLRVFARPDCFGSSASDAVFKDHFVDSFERVLPRIVENIDAKDRQTRLALLFSFMLNCGPVYYSEELRPRINGPWVHEFRQHAAFCAKKLDWHRLNEMKDSSSFLFADLIRFLFPKDLPLTQIVNLSTLDPVRRRGWSSSDFRDSKELEFWLIWRFRNNAEHCSTVSLHTLLPAFADLPADILGEKILGLLNAIHCAMSLSVSSKERLDALNDGWRVVARELIPFLKLLQEKQPDSQRERSPLLKAWWQLAAKIYCRSMGGLEAELSAELRIRLVESAAKHIGFLRKVLRETPEHFKGKDSTGEVADFYHEAFLVLCIFAPPWKRLKPLLLVFTEMTVPAIAADLRPWPEPDREPPPHPYSEIPMWIETAMYPQNVQDELKRDPYLQDLRGEFATFCLGRLKTKIKRQTDYTNADFTEPRPLWRQCYVQALAALRVNPGGRAHRTIFWLFNNDPDATVRSLAKKAHKRIRHLDRKKPNIDDGASPRRPLFEAFWWLRQAHLLTLGKEIDEAGAMRTRRKELHRTREKDDRLHWEA